MPITITGGFNATGGVYFGPQFFPSSLKHTLVSPFSFVSISDNLSDFTPGTGAFTVEGFFRFSGANTSQWASTRFFYGQSFGSIYADIVIYTTGTAILRFGSFTTSIDVNSSSFSDPVVDTWYHWVFQRDTSNNFSVYWNGVRVYYGSNTTNYNVTPSPALALCCGNVAGAGHYWWIDEFRYTSGAALYSGATIQVPTSEFTVDANTKCLLHFTGENGSTTTTDSTGRHTITLGANQSLDTSVYKL